MKIWKCLNITAIDEAIVRISHGLYRGERDFGVKTKQILCAHYREKDNDLAEVLRLCQKHYDKGVVGIDLLTSQPPEGVIGRVLQKVTYTFKNNGETFKEFLRYYLLFAVGIQFEMKGYKKLLVKKSYLPYFITEHFNEIKDSGRVS